MSTALQSLAGRLSIDANEMQSIVMNTVMPNGGKSVTEAQFTSFIAVANEYQLNPLTKEIYAFPAKGGGIQPIVSIDGWLKIINTHPEFDGMEFDDKADANGNLISVTCKIYRKDRGRATEMTEYMAECAKSSEPWQKWPSRMLRHKATIQAARYAFGLSGIIDPDEAERFQESGVIEKDITPGNEVLGLSAVQNDNINALLESIGKTWDELSKISKQLLGREITDIAELTEIEAAKLIHFLEGKVNAH